MPKLRGSKKLERSKTADLKSVSDLSINDFANCNASGTRVKKSTRSYFSREVKEICSQEKSWDEKDLTEFDVLEDSEEEDENSKLITKKKTKKKLQNCVPEDSTGKEYPLDLWFTLAVYIHPEDLKTFASLCQSAKYVVQTYSYWISLYKRFYDREITLPLQLQPVNIETTDSLRAGVIRSLFYLYPPFVQRVSKANSGVDGKAYNLIQKLCTSVWHRKCSGKWHFYFKFKPSFTLAKGKVPTSNNSLKRLALYWSHDDDQIRPDEVENIVQDFSSNPDEGSCILCAVMPHFASLPTVLGYYLADVKTTLARDMRGHNLQMFFTNKPYNCRSLKTKQPLVNGITQLISFEGVEQVQVLEWWHPQFPLTI